MKNYLNLFKCIGKSENPHKYLKSKTRFNFFIFFFISNVVYMKPGKHWILCHNNFNLLLLRGK